MINLIPNQEKKEKVKDFYFRLAVVALFMLSAVVAVAIVAMLPAYLLSSVKKSSTEVRLAGSVDPNGPEDTELQKLSQDLRSKLILVEHAETDKYLVSAKVIREILLRKSPGMKITEISFEKSPDESKKASVRGTAGSREELLRFRQALEESLVFEKVDLPISSFVRGTDIQFTLTLIPS